MGAGVESNERRSFSALTRGRPQGTIFDRIHRHRQQDNPYLLENYESCKTPNADRGAGGSGPGRIGLSDGPEAGFRGTAWNTAASQLPKRPLQLPLKPKLRLRAQAGYDARSCGGQCSEPSTLPRRLLLIRSMSCSLAWSGNTKPDWQITTPAIPKPLNRISMRPSTPCWKASWIFVRIIDWKRNSTGSRKE